MRQDTPPAPSPIRPDAPPAIRQGTVALVVGVVFVILAGLIFATTAWRILPDLFKVVLVLAFSGIFFGASAIADHRLNIRGTSKAFYILGSIFLFVAVLAVGYFRLLGPKFSLAGRNRYLLLLAGTVFTELALFAGLRKFTETVYAGCCLSGLTVAAALLTASFHPGRLGFALGMACYGLLVTGAAQFLARRKKESALPGILRIFPMFATINLCHEISSLRATQHFQRRPLKTSLNRSSRIIETGYVRILSKAHTPNILNHRMRSLYNLSLNRKSS